MQICVLFGTSGTNFVAVVGYHGSIVIMTTVSSDLLLHVSKGIHLIFIH